MVYDADDAANDGRGRSPTRKHSRRQWCSITTGLCRFVVFHLSCIFPRRWAVFTIVVYICSYTVKCILCTIGVFFQSILVALKEEKQALNSPISATVSRHLAQNEYETERNIGSLLLPWLFIRDVYHRHEFPFSWKWLSLTVSVWATQTEQIRSTALFSPVVETGEDKTKDAFLSFFILTFCSFFSDILSPCLANCPKCGTHPKNKKGTGEKREEREGEIYRKQQCKKRTQWDNSK